MPPVVRSVVGNIVERCGNAEGVNYGYACVLHHLVGRLVVQQQRGIRPPLLALGIVPAIEQKYASRQVRASPWKHSKSDDTCCLFRQLSRPAREENNVDVLLLS